MTYTIIIPESIKKKILKFGFSVSDRVYKKLEILANNPHIGKRLEGCPFWSARIGDYRIIYSIEYDKVSILVIDIDKRGKVYKRF